MITQWYKNLIKATTINPCCWNGNSSSTPTNYMTHPANSYPSEIGNNLTEAEKLKNKIIATDNTNYFVEQIKFCYNNSVMTIWPNATKLNLSGDIVYGIVLSSSDVPESPTKYTINNIVSKSGNNKTSDYVTLVNNTYPKLVRRWDRETDTWYLDIYMQLQCGSGQSNPVVIKSIGLIIPFVVNVSRPDDSNASASNLRYLLADYTLLPEPVTISELKDETIRYTIATSWNMGE